jgi:hypothetical protein
MPNDNLKDLTMIYIVCAAQSAIKWKYKAH